MKFYNVKIMLVNMCSEEITAMFLVSMIVDASLLVQRCLALVSVTY